LLKIIKPKKISPRSVTRSGNGSYFIYIPKSFARGTKEVTLLEIDDDTLIITKKSVGALL